MILRYNLSQISKVNNEDKTLFQVLQKEFNGKLNLARIKFLLSFKNYLNFNLGVPVRKSGKVIKIHI